MSHTEKNLPAMQETRVHSLGQKDPLKKEMATHSSILACGIPWTEEPGGVQSTGLQRVRHDSMTNTFKHISINACYIFTCEWILNLSGFEKEIVPEI